MIHLKQEIKKYIIVLGFFFFAQYQGGRIKLLRIFREMNSKTVSPKVWV